jgi:pimeloyl-ACP methyl ester carboxylesterase
VWKRQTNSAIEIAIAFRGTDGTGDWKHGNARWLTPNGEDQYERARRVTRKIVQEIEDLYGKDNPTLFSTGHSLGGGLAQHVLYDQPRHFLQAIVFNPSPVTGYGDFPWEKKKQACTCPKNRSPEARIYRLYESGEILSFLRSTLKEKFWLNRHIQEVVFNFSQSNPLTQHSMRRLATSLTTLADHQVAPEKIRNTEIRGDRERWYKGQGRCTSVFEEQQRKSCDAWTFWPFGPCPE